MTTRYNLRSRSNISAPKRLENEVFLPGSNNGYTAGRAIDMGADIDGVVERYDNQQYDLSFQPDVDDEYHVDSEPENVQELQEAIRGDGSEEDEEAFSEGEETEEDEDAYSVYSDDGDSTESEEEEIEDYDNSQEITMPAAKRRRIDTQEEKGPHVSDDSDSEWLPEDEEEEEDEYEAETPEQENDYLVDEYWRPTFSHNLDIEAALLEAPVNVNDPVAWKDGMTFVQTRGQTVHGSLLDNVVMIWRGESRYDPENGTEMKCYFFFQDISPFIYDYWNHDARTHIDSDWIPSSSLQWFVPMENEDQEYLIEVSSWTPRDVFNRNYTAESYGEWENEYLDTDEYSAPRPILNYEDEDYMSDDSSPDSIS